MPKIGQNGDWLISGAKKWIVSTLGLIVLSFPIYVWRDLKADITDLKTDVKLLDTRRETTDSILGQMATIQAHQAETIREQAKEIKELRGR